MIWILSLLPRSWLQKALYGQWRRTLPRHERIRLDYWGTTSNSAHHHFQWADDYPEPAALAHGCDVADEPCT